MTGSEDVQGGLQNCLPEGKAWGFHTSQIFFPLFPLIFFPTLLSFQKVERISPNIKKVLCFITAERGLKACLCVSVLGPQDGELPGHPDRSTALLPEQRRAEGCV